MGQIKERIRRETGFSPWAVDRYLDILHAWIAEKTGVNPKQVHKILVSYRLSRFRESFVKPPCPAFGGVAPPNMKIERIKD